MTPPSNALQPGLCRWSDVPNNRLVGSFVNATGPLDPRVHECTAPPSADPVNRRGHRFDEAIEEQVSENLCSGVVDDEVEVPWRHLESSHGQGRASGQPPGKTPPVDAAQKLLQGLVPGRHPHASRLQERLLDEPLEVLEGPVKVSRPRREAPGEAAVCGMEAHRPGSVAESMKGGRRDKIRRPYKRPERSDERHC